MAVFDHLRDFDHVPMQGPELRPSASDFRVHELEERVDKLTLVCLGLWELLREKNGLTEDDLTTSVAMIDAQDGVADGKVTRRVQACPKCNRPMSAEHRRCLYCGFTKPVETAFDTV